MIVGLSSANCLNFVSASNKAPVLSGIGARTFFLVLQYPGLSRDQTLGNLDTQRWDGDPLVRIWLANVHRNIDCPIVRSSGLTVKCRPTYHSQRNYCPTKEKSTEQIEFDVLLSYLAIFLCPLVVHLNTLSLACVPLSALRCKHPTKPPRREATAHHMSLSISLSLTSFSCSLIRTSSAGAFPSPLPYLSHTMMNYNF